MTTPDSIPELEELEIEEHAKKGGKDPAPHAKRYIIRVDKTKFAVTQSSMTGCEILELAGKLPPEGYKLTQKFHDGAATTVGLTDLIDFRAPGIERFMTMKRDQTEG